VSDCVLAKLCPKCGKPLVELASFQDFTRYACRNRDCWILVKINNDGRVEIED
jgi:hypothetical protein